jgi:hypothetical protein
MSFAEGRRKHSGVWHPDHNNDGVIHDLDKIEKQAAQRVFIKARLVIMHAKKKRDTSRGPRGRVQRVKGNKGPDRRKKEA